MPAMPSAHRALPAQAVSTQFASRPTLDTVTRQLLTELIRQRYPTLVIDLSRTQLAIPHPTGGWTLHPLMARVLEFLATGTALDLSDRHGESCYLTDAPPGRLKLAAPATSALDMNIIENLIKELPLTLPTALQNALATYWREEADNGVSRWRWLSDWLADNLRVAAISQAALDGPEREMLEQLINYPDRDERVRRFGANAVRAYYPRATLKEGQQTLPLLSPHLLLTQATRVLLCQTTGACERFSSMDASLQAWARQVAQPYVVEHITTQQWEPDGNVFDIQAALMLNQQLQDLGALTLPPAWNSIHFARCAWRSATPPTLFLMRRPLPRSYRRHCANKPRPGCNMPARLTRYAMDAIAWPWPAPRNAATATPFSAIFQTSTPSQPMPCCNS